MILKIAITGPESTGKTQLSERLAMHYNSLHVPEFAREYIDLINRPYHYDDIEIIAKKQIQSENELIKLATTYLFCDTDLLVTKVWSDFVFGKCSEWIEQKLINHVYDLYLLCDVDLEWEYDPQREHPHMRNELFEIYKNHLQNFKFPFAIVNGKGDDRILNAIKIIDKHFEKHHEQKT